jgi:multidrug efflux pump subunit AcrB
VLLAGLAKKLFVPLAVTVAVSMIASYFVSMCVTPLACRFFMGHAEPGRLGGRVAAIIDGVARRYSEALRATLSFRNTVIGACVALVGLSVWMAEQLPSTFFPEIDESMERVYVRLAPGTSLKEAAKTINAMGATLAKELPPGTANLVLTNVGSPGNARSAMTSPNAGPHMGFIRVALSEPEHRRLSQREIADNMRDILNRNFPGVELLQWPGGLVASVFSNGYIAPLVVELEGNSLEELNAESKAIAEVARTVPGIRDVYPALQMDYPEVRIETDRTAAALVDVSARAAAQSTLEATLGNINTPSVWIDGSNGQSYYVVTSYDRHVVDDPDALARVPVRIGPGGAAVTLGAYSRIRRSTGPILIERNHLDRVAHVMMQTEGRDIGSAARELEAKLQSDPRTRALHTKFVGQVELMRTTFSGLGLAVGLAIMVVFMIMASQFKSLRLPFIMLFTIPVSLIGIVLALVAAGQGFSIPALMGVLMVVGIAVSNGILLIDDANRRFNEGMNKVEAVVAAARTRFIPIAMTSLATVIGLLPTALGLEAGTESNQPLALAVVGGITSSTVLSLFLVPAMFLLLAKRTAQPEAAGHSSLLVEAPQGR